MTIYVFREQLIESYFKQIDTKIINNAQSMGEKQMLSLDAATYAQKVAEENKIFIPKLDKDNLEIQTKKEHTPLRGGKSFQRDTCIYSIPFSGNRELFGCSPIVSNNNLLIRVKISNNILTIPIQTDGIINNSELIRKELADKAKLIINVIEEGLEILRNNVDEYNDSLESKITEAIENYQQEIKASRDKRKQVQDELNPFKEFTRR